MLKSSSCALVMLFLLVCVISAEGSPTYQIKVKKRVLSKPTDSIVVYNERNRTVFLVTDSFGIGSATISLTSGRWPKQIVLRFRHEKGRGFRRLEGFSLTTTRLQVEGGMSTSGKMRFYLPDADGKFNTREPSAGELNILAEERNGAMEIVLPANLFTGSKDVNIGWIDAYR